jgi:pentapeptide repeat protein
MTEAYEAWWPKHTLAWAARYARDKQSASEEYGEVEDLWLASKKVLELERTRLKPKGLPDSHVNFLKLGVEAWNAWRRENPGLAPNLWKADFTGANLREADLAVANLSRADLARADLMGANLNNADLHGQFCGRHSL